MTELHTSPHRRKIIAEINRSCRTDLVIPDSSGGFAIGGPDHEKLIRP